MISVLPLKHKPALQFFVAFGVGIATSHSFISDHAFSVKVSVLVLLALGITFLLFRHSLSSYKEYIYLLAVALLGVLSHSLVEASYEHSTLRKLANTSASEVTAFGRVASSERSGNHIFSVIQCDSIHIDSIHLKCQEKLGIQLYRDAIESAPQVGGYISIVGVAEEIVVARNPYDNSYTERLRRNENVCAIISSSSKYDIAVIDSTRRLSLTEQIAKFADNARTSISHSITTAIDDSNSSGYVRAMLLGERESIPTESWQEFQRTGLSHILVVSGFNLGIIAAVFFYILRLLRIRNRKMRILLTMIAVISYALLIGNQPSLLRAAIVVMLFLIAKLTERKTHLVNLSAAAACINLIINPNELFDIGFQLSYCAVFSLAIIAPQLDRLFASQKQEHEKSESSYLKTVRTASFGTLAVFLGMLPILAYHFHQQSIIGLLVNIIAIPLSGLITVLSIILIPLSLLSSWLTSLYADVLIFLVHFMTIIAKWGSSLPAATVSIAHPSIELILLYIAMLIYVLSSETRKRMYGKCTVCIAVALMFFGLNIPVSYSNTRQEGNLTMTFFDVGQGDGILITTPHGKEYMVDFGGISMSGSTSAERAIIPFLKAESISSLEGGFITHMHADHYGGAAILVSEGYVKHLYTCGEKTIGILARTLDSISIVNEVPVSCISDGEKIVLDDNVALYVLNPENMNTNISNFHDGSQVNHRSLVLKLVYENTSTLFLGDVEGVDEKRLVKKYGDFLHTDVVKVAHHGSKTSSTNELLSVTRPKYAIISVGKNNKFGHPSDEVVRKWNTSGAKVCRTDNDGAVILRTDGKTIEKVHWRN